MAEQKKVKKVSWIRQFMTDSEAPTKVYKNLAKAAAHSVPVKAVGNITYNAARWTVGPVLNVSEPVATKVWGWLEAAAADPVVVK